MSIRTRIEDAYVQYVIGRPEGALLCVLTAVSATSRRRRPRGTPSLRKPGKKMGDGEAFELFLIDTMREIVGAPTFKIKFRGSLHPLENVLYKWFRCELAHAAALPSDVHLVPEPDSGAIRVGVDKSGLMISHGLLDRLANVVISAPENADLFGSPPEPPIPIYLPRLDVTIAGPNWGVHQTRKDADA